MNKQQQMASKGGKARASKLSASRRREIALLGVAAKRKLAKKRKMASSV